ncbi:MAG: diguanylate cyclase [Campylobacteraceae bacterium]|nr:diguanylate cyclase [Campylobacteraceae bacterium]
MFKNILFLKIVLVFTLPALGMLYFSTLLVYEKVQVLSELKNAKLNIKYLRIADQLVHSLQKERGYSTTFLTSKKYHKELMSQRKNTNILFKKYVNIISSNNFADRQLIYTIKKVQNRLYKIDFLRKSVDNLSLSTMEILFSYNKINTLLLDSIFSIKPVDNAANFNTKLTSMSKLLLVKENAGIERALTAMLISKNFLLDYDTYHYLVKLHTIQDLNIKDFFLKADIIEVNKYNEIISVEDEIKISKIRQLLKLNNAGQIVSMEDWWNLSTKRIEALNKVHQFSIREILNLAKKLETDAYMAQVFSLSFLFVSFLTLISLFFVLKNIIFNEQKSFNKITKQKNIYDVLSKTNKVLLKITSEKNLFKKICSLIVKEAHMPFGFVCKFDNDSKLNVFFSEGALKEYLIDKMGINTNEEVKNIGLAQQAYIQRENIIVDSLKDNDISLLTGDTDKYNINSAAAFPIFKFGEVYAVMVIYSNVFDYFDKEIEILFTNLIHDITHTLEKIDYEDNRLKQENELRIASYAFESHEPMIITNSDIEIINANKAFCSTSGYTKEELLSKNPRLLKSDYQDETFYKKMWAKISKKGMWTGELVNKRKNGETVPFRATITAIKNNENVVTHYIGQYIDITEQKSKQKVLEYQATHDSLTGLPNRLLLLDRITQSLAKVARHGVVGGLVFIDLDNFKTINDTLGHEVGDQLLIEVALMLRKTIREEDTVARIGGDEFIILADCIGNDPNEAKENMLIFVKKIKNSLNSITEISGHKNISTPSIGVTLFSDASIGVNEIIKQADTAMYNAKKAGKNSIEFF